MTPDVEPGVATAVFSNAREGILVTDAQGIIIDVNPAFTRITGYTREEVLGRNPRMLRSDRHSRAFYQAMWRSLLAHGHWHGEVWNRRKDGELFAELLSISAVRDGGGRVHRYVGFLSDITQQKEHERQLEHIVHYDVLTGLPNRALFADRLQQAMLRANRSGMPLAVAYIDLDGFKTVNDRYGRDAGDQLLTVIAARMRKGLRESDTLARLGGDEFVAVLCDLPDQNSSRFLVSRLLATIAEPVVVDEQSLQVSGSVGVTTFPQRDEIEADQLLRQADQAMYQAKLAGKNRYHLFDAEQDHDLRSHHESLERIRLGFSRQEFVLHYQPKVNMRSGEVIGAEALIRWQHPEQGLLPPARFLPALEHHPLGIALGEWVIDTALAQIENWRDQGLHVPVSVNIAANHLQRPDFAQRLATLLTLHPGVEPAMLQLEVLESSALADMSHVAEVMGACVRLGVGFALDDFGTGYSSLTYLKRLPAQMLKIDRSFVYDMLHDADDLAILDGVLGLARAFRRGAIAEGVETVDHGELLLRLGCECAQGYAIARPMPPEELPAWAAAWEPPERWTRQRHVGTEARNLLYAGVEHRGWIISIGRYLEGESDVPPVLDPHQCAFGRWLDGVIADPYALGGDRLQALDLLHQQVHALAAELIELHQRGRGDEARAGLARLYVLRDRTIEMTESFLQAF
ncbi:EAL domain-containing protein [Thauera linaloolentis]|uniref:PAS domain S-box/diguanylate cyclase (GGDEF) domain-containing protein n=1 Tax=Thauera linaloolentis (strain DSM 12138 / JCM 21573 / CCUG 41526 / CIP 105981 / IAM 15112 / NBRC 102519 / 47Lol) TaxID=1123367 RepID=N6Y356_THAL4|nr:EAL domain-containing protein [Thauera linaloolentis]ENO85965.1 PAS domain S-box/diguanylate cyclase (GGDEF) domain-containing protein [Thauera linaloolentis 47Lol = DSM 12138]MCM8567195.1 EAL domain-containing protein [Thauera linaloolentis]